MRFLFRSALVGVFCTPLLAFAHEVYVLDATAILDAIATPRFSLLAVLTSHLGEFLFWASVSVTIVILVFIFSIARFAEKFFSPTFERIRPWAFVVSRITVGLSFLAAAFYQANYGPELPLVDTFGNLAPLATAVLVLIGTCITMGIFVRTAAFIAFAFYIISIYFNGFYMLTYVSYLGEILVLILLGTHLSHKTPSKGFARNVFSRTFEKFRAKFAPYSFLILRVAFGISVMYSALYAKFWYNNLALAVAANPLADHFYSLAHYLGFEPHFLVLGAGIIELAAGFLFVLGIEIRFLALFLEFWLILSLFYFGESVWPHLMLFGIPIAFFLYGYDKYSLEGRYFKKGRLQPVL
jgi:uncharacterized membrane protein YphA (DoxX/SURF4 family)